MGTFCVMSCMTILFINHQASGHKEGVAHCIEPTDGRSGPGFISRETHDSAFLTVHKYQIIEFV